MSVERLALFAALFFQSPGLRKARKRRGSGAEAARKRRGSGAGGSVFAPLSAMPGKRCQALWDLLSEALAPERFGWLGGWEWQALGGDDDEEKEEEERSRDEDVDDRV